MTELAGSPGGFQSTLWSNVLSAKNADSPGRKDALERLVQTYWKHAYFFVRRSGHDVETARDLTQGFFSAFLERDFLQYVKQDRGKFRSFFLTTLKHYLADERDRDRAQKRGGGRAILSLDFAGAESEFSMDPPSGESADRLFKKRWALQVLSRALRSLREEYKASGRKDEFKALKHHVGSGSSEPGSYLDISAALGITVEEARKRAWRLRNRFRELILEEIRSYAPSEEEAGEELNDLFHAMGRAS